MMYTQITQSDRRPWKDDEKPWMTILDEIYYLLIHYLHFLSND